MPTKLKTIVGYLQQLVVFTDNFVVGLDAELKTVSWEMHLTDLPPYSIHGVVQQENIVYFAIGPQDWNKGLTYLVAFDTLSQEFLWKWKFPIAINEGSHVIDSEELSAPSVYIKNGPIIFDDKLHFTCSNGCVYQIPIGD
jgi:outer membrane protein assembly factor BamB